MPLVLGDDLLFDVSQVPPPPPRNFEAPVRARVNVTDAVVSHGFVDSGPGPAATPPPPSVVENDDRKRRTSTVPPIVLSGALATTVVAPTATPPPPVVVQAPDVRRRTPDPISISAALTAVTGAVAATPPAPFVVPIEERRRLLAAQPQAAHGWDEVAPPQPNVVEPDDRKRRRAAPLDPISLSAALQATSPAVVPPPGPFVVPLTERNRLLERLPTVTFSHGFVDPGPAAVGTTPPPILNIDRVDQRARYLPQPSLVLSGVLVPFVPPPPVVVLAGTDWAAEMSTW